MLEKVSGPVSLMTARALTAGKVAAAAIVVLLSFIAVK
jgi:hypothetical protein